MFNFGFVDDFYETLRILLELWVTRSMKKETEVPLPPTTPKADLNDIRQCVYKNWNNVDYDELMINHFIYSHYRMYFLEFCGEKLMFHNTDWLLKPDGYISISDIETFCIFCGCDLNEFKNRVVKLMQETGHTDYSIDTFDALFNDQTEATNDAELIKWRDQYAN